MAYTLNNNCAQKLLQMDSSSLSYHRTRSHVFLEHSVQVFPIGENLGKFGSS